MPNGNGCGIGVCIAGEPGPGRLLYATPEKLFKTQGYRTLYALMAVPNPAGEDFHERMGFERQVTADLMEFAAGGSNFGRRLV